MTHQEALSILGTEPENFEEKVLELIFEHKNFLLKSVITPQVFKTRAQKIYLIGEANNTLLNVPNQSEQQSQVSMQCEHLTIESLLAFYRAYEGTMSQKKLQLMQSLNPYEIAYCCSELAVLEDQKMRIISRLFYDFEEIDTTVKISDFVNSGSVIQELKQSLEKEINLKNYFHFPTLHKDVSRSKKYSNFMDLKKTNNA